LAVLSPRRLDTIERCRGELRVHSSEVLPFDAVDFVVRGEQSICLHKHGRVSTSLRGVHNMALISEQGRVLQDASALAVGERDEVYVIAADWLYVCNI